jgi:hypothetical protein
MSGLDIYFQDNLTQGIAAVTCAMLSASVANGGANVEYCRGVLDTSRAFALIYGIPWVEVAGPVREVLAGNVLLDVVALALPGGEK